MTDIKERLRIAAEKRDGFDAVYLAPEAADRIAQLEAALEAANVDWGKEFYRAEAAEARIAELEASLATMLDWADELSAALLPDRFAAFLGDYNEASALLEEKKE